jgi:hypothetical protein
VPIVAAFRDLAGFQPQVLASSEATVCFDLDRSTSAGHIAGGTGTASVAGRSAVRRLPIEDIRDRGVLDRPVAQVRGRSGLVTASRTPL